MDQDFEILIVSALLHDIGKFAQRANRPRTDDLAEEYLPSFQGKRSHYHALYSDYFIEKDLPLPPELEGARSRIARVASVHHRPNESDLSEMCIMIADRLSSGMDRLEFEQSEGQPGFKESRLISIFDEIELREHEFKAPGNFYYPLNPLDAGGNSIFPVKGEPTGKPEEYIPLFELFIDELRKIKIDLGFQFYLESIISLLEKYTWSVPSSTYKTLSDVSLFDHSFGTAGIAQSLYIFQKTKDEAPKWKDNEYKFLLLCGDLSGIQKYLFGVSKSSGRGVSKIFRARSFFLQTVTRSINLEIQKRTGLFSVCRLVDSGGKFIAIIPNSPRILEEIERLDKEIQIWFRKKFKGLLSMSLSWSTHLTQQDFQMKYFKHKIDEANEALDAAKLHKLHRTFADNGLIIDTDYNEFEGGNCSICEINAADGRSSDKYKEKEGVATPICRECCDQIVYVGTRLPRTEHLIYGKQGRIQLFGDIHLTLASAPPSDFKDVYHVDSLVDGSNFSRFRVARHLPQIRREELADERWFKLFRKEDGFDEMIQDIGNDPEVFIPKTFGMIADKSRKELNGGEMAGRPLLGFLKADVDNLGLVFSLGLGDKLSVARMGFLSRMLNIFFSDYIAELLKRKFPDIYVVFSGGDDLFLIGPWWQITHFAIALREKLGHFCSNNPDLTLSCGILTTRARFPVRKAVEITEEHLNSAKSYKSKDRVKDSVSFLGEVLSWQKLEALLKIGEKLDKALEEKQRTNFTTAFMYRLLAYHRMYRKFIEQGDIKSGKYLSHAHYDIARNIRQKNLLNQEELDFLYKIFAVGVTDRTELYNLNIPLFYAINLNREFN
jgi:CRISPR-associated protein Csm1